MIHVEKAKPEDAAELTELTLSSKAHWGYSREQMEQWREDLTVRETYIRKNEAYLTRLDGEIAGYYAYHSLDESTSKLDNLFIAPAYMGKGLGKELMHDFFARIKQTSCKTITLDADPHAESFYLKFGFQTVDQLETSIPGRFLPVMELLIG